MYPTTSSSSEQTLTRQSREGRPLRASYMAPALCHPVFLVTETVSDCSSDGVLIRRRLGVGYRALSALTVRVTVAKEPGTCTVFLFSQEDHFADRITCDGMPFGNFCEIWCGPRARSEKGPVLGMRRWCGRWPGSWILWHFFCAVSFVALSHPCHDEARKRSRCGGSTARSQPGGQQREGVIPMSLVSGRTTAPP